LPVCEINISYTVEMKDYIYDRFRFFSIPEHILPEIKSSSTIFGYINKGALQGIPIGAVR